MDYVQCVYADGNRNSAKGVDISGKDLVPGPASRYSWCAYRYPE